MPTRYSDMDDTDRALSIDELAMKRYHERQERIAACTHAAPLRTHCTVCGEPLPAVRIMLHALRCLDCQAEFERGLER